MTTYDLSGAAALDLEAIYVFGAEHFGVRQAEKYTSGLLERFQEIASQATRWPAVDWIRPGYRRSVYVSHTVYYQVMDERVLIVRILSRQDPLSSLS